MPRPKIDIWFNEQFKTITSVTGKRTYEINGETKTDTHKGYDIRMPENTELIAPIDCFLKSGYRNDIGYYLVLSGIDYRINLFHLNKIYDIDKDVLVKAEYPICLSGKTGIVSAEHLHVQFALAYQSLGKWTDPAEVLSERLLSSFTYPEGFIRTPKDICDCKPKKEINKSRIQLAFGNIRNELAEIEKLLI